jgi:hypothetical protein
MNALMVNIIQKVYEKNSGVLGGNLEKEFIIKSPISHYG